MRVGVLPLTCSSSPYKNGWQYARVRFEGIKRQQLQMGSADYRPKLGRESTRYGTSPEPDDTTQSIFMG
jgi:hypothetical protein